MRRLQEVDRRACRLKVHVTGGDRVDRRRGVYAHLAAQPERYEVTGSRPALRAVGERVAAERRLSCPPERYTRADLGDLAAVEQAFAGGRSGGAHGARCPIHRRRSREIVHSNVAGGYNALEACRRQGIRRIVYASTVMTDWGLPVRRALQGDPRGALRRRAGRLPPRYAPRCGTPPPSPIRRARYGARDCAGPTPTATACRACACASAAREQGGRTSGARLDRLCGAASATSPP